MQDKDTEQQWQLSILEQPPNLNQLNIGTPYNFFFKALRDTALQL